jgi:uncharacterized Ntn-hydrolase superfamily protein
MNRFPLVATYSIVGRNPYNGDLGVAVQSRFFAAGAIVPWARAGVGAVATQAFVNPQYGPNGLSRMGAGIGPDEVLVGLTDSDEDRSVRQVGAVDANGRSACYTGADCIGWAGHISGENFAAQGNMLVGEETVAAMANKFQNTRGDLADRLIAALKAAEEAGGDARGKQAAALLVVRDKGGFMGLSDRYVDIRVDDHTDPINELDRLLGLQRTVHLCVDSARLASEGAFEQAIVKVEQARDREPADVNVLYFLARAYMLAGRSEDAFRILGDLCAQHESLALLVKRDKVFNRD